MDLVNNTTYTLQNRTPADFQKGIPNRRSVADVSLKMRVPFMLEWSGAARAAHDDISLRKVMAGEVRANAPTRPGDQHVPQGRHVVSCRM